MIAVWVSCGEERAEREAVGFLVNPHYWPLLLMCALDID